MKKLVYKGTDREVKVGDTVVSFRGTSAKVTGWDEPRHAASTGRIYVREKGSAGEGSYFPGVFATEFVEA